MSRPRVLMYHGFGHRPAAEDPHFLYVGERDLDRQVAFLRKYLRPLDLRGFVAGWRAGGHPARSFLVTIDDGYASTLSIAAPMLARQGVPAVVFVCPGLLGERLAWTERLPSERLLTADEVRSLPELGLEVGVHGRDHTLLPGLSEAELRRQVADSRDAVADITGVRPAAFAYPEGKFDAAAMRAVRDAGYSVAFSVLEGGDRFSVPRIPVTSRDSMATFVTKLAPGFHAMFRATQDRPRVRKVAAWAAGSRRRGRLPPDDGVHSMDGDEKGPARR